MIRALHAEACTHMVVRFDLDVVDFDVVDFDVVDLDVLCGDCCMWRHTS